MVVYSPLDFTPVEPQSPKPSKVGTHTLAELLSYVRSAEQKLTAAGLTTRDQHINALRGIYYGTAWSLDHQQSKSGPRDAAFNYYTDSGLLPPPDVRPLLGATLFANLYECAEFILTAATATNPSVKLDFGHLMIGLDARRSLRARTEVLAASLNGGTGLAVCTWLGDLGGAAGQLAYKRASYAPGERAINEFKGSNFGGTVNLEGDIAAYLVGAPLPPFTGVPGLPATGTLSSLIEDYCQVGSALWQARVATFLQIIGAKISGATIVNREEFRQYLAQSFRRFGSAYLVFRMTKIANPAKVFSLATRHLQGTSNEVAAIFLNLMEQSLKAPAGTLAPATLNPVPTPPGSIFRLLEAIPRLPDLERSKLLNEAADWSELWKR